MTGARTPDDPRWSRDPNNHDATLTVGLWSSPYGQQLVYVITAIANEYRWSAEGYHAFTIPVPAWYTILREPSLPSFGLTYDNYKRLVRAGDTTHFEEYGCDPRSQRLWTKGPDEADDRGLKLRRREMTFYGPDGQRIAGCRAQWSYYDIPNYSVTCQNQDVRFAGRLVRTQGMPWVDDPGNIQYIGSAQHPDRLHSRGRRYSYGELREGETDDEFATYLHDSRTGFHYANQRYYDPRIARFLTSDPSAARDPASPQSWNLYNYVLDDPINAFDPDGLDVRRLNVTFTDHPTCLEEFTQHISMDVNKWLNSDQGTMALQVDWEHRGKGTSVDEMVWSGIANAFRNRWRLTNADKKKYGFTTAGFKQLIYSTTGPKWNKRGSAQSDNCKGMIDAFRVSDRVYNARPHDESVDTTSGALWFYAAGAGGTIPENPFRLNIPIFASEVIPGAYSNGRMVAWFFYRLVAGWSY